MKTKLLITAAFISLMLNGCILDSLDTINQDLPYSIAVNLVNKEPTDAYIAVPFDISQSSAYQDYAGDITKLEYVRASFRTTELSSPALQGDMTISLVYGNDSTILTETITPETYKTTPFVLEIPAAEKGKLNAYLTNGGREFIVTVRLSNVTPSQTVTLRGYIDVIFNLEANI